MARIKGRWDRSRTWHHSRSRERQQSSGARRVPRVRRVQAPCSARRDGRGVRSGAGCGVARHGADGPGRRSSSVSRAWWTRPPPIHSPRTAAGRQRMTRPSRRSSSRGSCLRILDQGLGPTRARSSRDRPLESPCTMARRAQGWAGHPCHSQPMGLTSTGTPAPDARAPYLVTRRADRDLCLSSDSCLLE